MRSLVIGIPALVIGLSIGFTVAEIAARHKLHELATTCAEEINKIRDVAVEEIRKLQ